MRLEPDRTHFLEPEITSDEICYGSAGVWNVLNPEPVRELGDRKARDVLATGADLLVTANPGCLMQAAPAVHRAGGVIGLGAHVHVLDASIRGLPPQIAAALSNRADN